LTNRKFSRRRDDTIARAKRRARVWRKAGRIGRWRTMLASVVAAGLGGAGLALSACSGLPSQAEPVVAAGASAGRAIAWSYARDLAWLRACLADQLSAQRTLALGRAHRALIEAGYLTPEGANVEAFRADLALPAGQRPAGHPLLDEVLSERMSREDAERFLRDYAVAASMSTAQSQSLRHAMLGSLSPLRAQAEQAGALLAAFDAHAAAVLALLAELGENHAALASAFEMAQSGTPIARRAFWEPVLDRIEDPALRAAVERLLGQALH
jgi:hypothetical protein